MGSTKSVLRKKANQTFLRAVCGISGIAKNGRCRTFWPKVAGLRDLRSFNCFAVPFISVFESLERTAIKGFAD